MATMAAVPLIMSAVAAAASVAGTIYSTQRAAAAEDYQAEVAKTQGEQAMMAAEAEAKDRRRRARYLLGAQIADTAASGLALEGSPLLAMVDSGVQEDLEARRILYKGKLAQTGARADAALANYQASSTRMGGYMSAGVSLLRSGSNMYGQSQYGSNWRNA